MNYSWVPGKNESKIDNDYVKSLIDKDDLTFKSEMLGEWVTYCDVKDGKGNYCDGKPVHFFEHNGKEVGVCEKCYIGYQKGAFDESAKRKLRGNPLYIAQQRLFMNVIRKK